MDLKVMFIAAYLSEEHSFSQLCQDYQISRKTGYKWVERYRGPPQRAIPGPVRLTRRPAGLPTAQGLRSASVV
ncbi:integrase catalytic subunit [Pseudomonas sp. CFII64]|nr:integrase catalytic subunit [Pseudomonas sp. CFII64]